MPENIDDLDETATGTDEAKDNAEGQNSDNAGADQLGEAGKKALDRMKAERNAAKAESAAFKKLGLSADDLRALIDKSETDKSAAEAARARQDAESAALAKANERLIKAEVRAAATGKLANPQIAMRLLDLASFDVNEDGEVDSDAITSAIDELLTKEPYLAAQGGKRFQGTGDGGPRNAGNAQPPQLTKADLERMSREGKYDEITEAKKAGRFNDLLGIKP